MSRNFVSGFFSLNGSDGLSVPVGLNSALSAGLPLNPFDSLLLPPLLCVHNKSSTRSDKDGLEAWRSKVYLPVFFHRFLLSAKKPETCRAISD